MGTNSAGKVGGGNEGKTDMGRGSVMNFPFNKGRRQTGKVGSGMSQANSNAPDSNKRMANDPRLVK